MKTYLIGAVVGALMTCAIIYPFAMVELARKEQVARDNGFLDGIQHTVKALSKRFNEPPQDADVEVMYSIKTTDVVAFTVDGIDTIGIVP
ncbi:hypothetical protein EUZ85_17200 [Hahella sp. KA22]|uniref:hypothetical protein n=1 Tax=Hahella sp. KA22 TaxID=1628392 RepID=UPI000FDDED37|nr:hypothetical protein [Hahella sp. KA22]AZZ92364.1 hypothetical protein ENC22_14625 [Hahella sp. KA22]QAY55737.1 hypothetical protein EUZ85_17200 [Hahella sp. KA22]